MDPETDAYPTDQPAGAGERTAALDDIERAVLDFTNLRRRYTGAKEAAIREQFGWSTTRYHQVLGALLGRPEAAAYAPVLVGRLRRLAEARRQQLLYVIAQTRRPRRR